jgi:hypothetical protein
MALLDMNAVLTLALPVVGRRPALERVCLAADIGIVQAVWREIAHLAAMPMWCVPSSAPGHCGVGSPAKTVSAMIS